ncbi:MAG TPA: 30S ribosomal protein S17 [bacterium]|nr:30S ribosomal protein S17 [bacterium]
MITKKTKKTIKGVVKSDKMDKTIVVEVHNYKRHPKYFKRFRITKKYFAHDPKNLAGYGDTVIIEESRPLSRQKRWILKSIVSKASELVRSQAATTEESNQNE